MFPHGFDALVLDHRLRLGRAECWPALSAVSWEKERQSLGNVASHWASAVWHQYLILRDALLSLEEGEAQYKLVVQMPILLAYIPCKQVIIYSSDMSHLCRYHGYSVSPANSMKYSQLFTVFCTCACVTKWLFFSSGSPSSLSWWELEPTGIWNPSTAKKLPCNRNRTSTAVDF